MLGTVEYSEAEKKMFIELGWRGARHLLYSGVFGEMYRMTPEFERVVTLATENTKQGENIHHENH